MNSIEIYLGTAGWIVAVLAWVTTLSLPFWIWRLKKEKPHLLNKAISSAIVAAIAFFVMGIVVVDVGEGMIVADLFRLFFWPLMAMFVSMSFEIPLHMEVKN